MTFRGYTELLKSYVECDQGPGSTSSIRFKLKCKINLGLRPHGALHSHAKGSVGLEVLELMMLLSCFWGLGDKGLKLLNLRMQGWGLGFRV